MRAPVRAGLLCAALAVAISGCGSSQPKSAGTQAKLQAAVKRAPGPLARLYSHGGEILDGGPAAYKRQIAALRGYPIVVNKWASWCGPCKFEFPFFQKLAAREGKRIAFLGVDGEDAKSDARAFLKKYPVPYPSFFDPHDKIAALFRGNIGFPTTAFYDQDGKLVYTKPGGYSSLQALEKDVKQYAR